MQNIEKLLGIKIDPKQNFTNQIGRILTKSQYRITNFGQSSRLNKS